MSAMQFRAAAFQARFSHITRIPLEIEELVTRRAVPMLTSRHAET